MKKLIIDFKNPTILLQNKFCFHDYYIIYNAPFSNYWK